MPLSTPKNVHVSVSKSTMLSNVSASLYTFENPTKTITFQRALAERRAAIYRELDPKIDLSLCDRSSTS
jgi:hypothetical protein